MSFYIKILFLAILQGITEFLPISSSGHLAIVQQFFNFSGETSFLITIILHGGTLLAIICFYFQEVLQLVKFKNNKVLFLLILGSIPIGIFGFMVEKLDFGSFLFSNIYISGCGLLVTGSLLKWGSCKNKTDREKKLEQLSIKETLLIGVFQALAVFPGISRSGSTITGSLAQGLNYKDSATFTFLLAIPAIFGATLLQTISAINNPIAHSPPIFLLFLGFFTSAFIGYIALKILLKILQKGKLKFFSYYCFAAGILVISWEILTNLL